MQIDQISLTDFRNYRKLDLILPSGPTLLYGDNAQGKTNLLEALYYLATTRSSHADKGSQLINWEALKREEPIAVGRITATVKSKHDVTELEIRLIQEMKNGRPSFRREALINKRKVRLMDLLGALRVILFLPQEMRVITGPPSDRRRYIDITLCQVDTGYCRALSAYNRVLEERNALLKQIGDEQMGLDLLPVYTAKLVETGSHVFRQRRSMLDELNRMAGEIYFGQLTDRQEHLTLEYLPRLGIAGRSNSSESAEQAEWLLRQDHEQAIAERYQNELAAIQKRELASGVTLLGPHRDDWRFAVNHNELASFGSRGQQRTALLALKLAEIQWITQKTGETPVLLLDEVVAELDKKRRALLLETVQDIGQAILTATDPAMFPLEFLHLATTMKIAGGQIVKETRSQRRQQ